MADVLSSLARSNERETMTHYLVGLILIILSGFHLFDQVDKIESKITHLIQQALKQNPWLAFFKDIWVFGRTSFSLIMLSLFTFFDWKRGLIAVGVFVLIIGVEYLVKSLYFRNRPFISQHGISNLQPVEPLDSSFPSGDTLRVWYLALIFSAVSGGNIFFLIAVIFVAVLVTLGRLVMGVHYLTDTLAGAGLGIIGAGTTLWLWNILLIS